MASQARPAGSAASQPSRLAPSRRASRSSWFQRADLSATRASHVRSRNDSCRPRLALIIPAAGSFHERRGSSRTALACPRTSLLTSRPSKRFRVRSRTRRLRLCPVRTPPRFPSTRAHDPPESGQTKAYLFSPINATNFASLCSGFTLRASLREGAPQGQLPGTKSRAAGAEFRRRVPEADVLTS